MKLNALLVLLAILGLVFTVWGISSIWADLGVQMTMHGWIAYGLGSFFSLLLAGGLFFLLFKSAREGYDDIDRPEDLND